MEHLVKAPPSDDGYEFGVDTGIEKVIGACVSQVAGRNVGRQKTKRWSKVGDGVFKYSRDLGWGNVNPAVNGIADIQGRLRGSIV